MLSLRISLDHTSCLRKISIDLNSIWPTYDDSYFESLLNNKFKTFQFINFNFENNKKKINNFYLKDIEHQAQRWNSAPQARSNLRDTKVCVIYLYFFIIINTYILLNFIYLYYLYFFHYLFIYFHLDLYLTHFYYILWIY